MKDSFRTESERIKQLPSTIAKKVVDGEFAPPVAVGIDPKLWENDTAVMAKTFNDPQYWLILVGVKAMGKSTQLPQLGELLHNAMFVTLDTFQPKDGGLYAILYDAMFKGEG